MKFYPYHNAKKPRSEAALKAVMNKIYNQLSNKWHTDKMFHNEARIHILSLVVLHFGVPGRNDLAKIVNECNRLRDESKLQIESWRCAACTTINEFDYCTGCRVPKH